MHPSCNFPFFFFRFTRSSFIWGNGTSVIRGYVITWKVSCLFLWNQTRTWMMLMTLDVLMRSVPAIFSPLLLTSCYKFLTTRHSCAGQDRFRWSAVIHIVRSDRKNDAEMGRQSPTSFEIGRTTIPVVAASPPQSAPKENRDFIRALPPSFKLRQNKQLVRKKKLRRVQLPLHRARLLITNPSNEFASVKKEEVTKEQSRGKINFDARLGLLFIVWLVAALMIQNKEHSSPCTNRLLSNKVLNRYERGWVTFHRVRVR